MNIIQRDSVKQLLANVAVYTAVDSLKNRSVDISNITLNSLTNLIYNLIIKSFVVNRLPIDPLAGDIIEDYTGRLVSLYLAKMFLEKGSANFKTLAKDQIYYSIALYLAVQGFNLLPGTKPNPALPFRA